MVRGWRCPATACKLRDCSFHFVTSDGESEVHVRIVLLLGVALNFVGGVQILFSAMGALAAPGSAANQYLHFHFLAAGTALVFGSLYLYLYFHPAFVIPFLIFGAALKTWAFLLCAYLYSKRRLLRRTLFEFGVTNGIIAALFWIYIASTL
jgi:hypothetical protein